MKYYEESNLRGKFGYAREIFKVLWRKKIIAFTIINEGKRIQRMAFMLVIANASMYGTGAVINPGANLEDGLFEIIVIRKLSVSELLKMLFLRTPFNPQKTEIIQAEQIEITTSAKAHFQVDGEYLGRQKSLSVTIKKQALTVIYPAVPLA